MGGSLEPPNFLQDRRTSCFMEKVWQTETMSIIKSPVPATWIKKTQKSPAGKKALYPRLMTVHCWHGSSPAPAKRECRPGERKSG